MAISDAKRRIVYERDQWRCQYCGLAFDPDLTWNPRSVAPYRDHERLGWVFLEIDHVHPRHHGGGDEITNLRAACTVCNRQKSFHPLAEVN